jgi:diguanylate cyclase (GGDEF)-like protein
MPDHDALLASFQESRSRWRALACLDTALLFETDLLGNIAFLAPDMVLGHAAASWLNQPAEALLGTPLPQGRTRRLRSAAIDAGGASRILDITAEPMPLGGLRGIARDVTLEAREAEAGARALRRATTLGRVLRLGSQQRGAGAALDAMLGALPAALGAAGAAVLARGVEGEWMAVAGATPPPVLPPHHRAETADHALLAWRCQPFDTEERDLLAALALPICTLQAEAARQAVLEGAARRDALTGLLNRFAFEEAVDARLQDSASGTMAFIDLDGLKPLNDRFGHDAGDAALRLVAQRLQCATRRCDLAARLGGDEFCLWLEGSLPAEVEARLAEACAPGPLPDVPEAGAAAVAASLGVAEAKPGEPLATLMARADAAMYARKRTRRAGRAA